MLSNTPPRWSASDSGRDLSLDLQEAREPEFRSALQIGFKELICGNVIPTRQEQERLLREAGFTGEIRRAFIGQGLTLLTTQRDNTQRA
jgi:hypothetical protein